MIIKLRERMKEVTSTLEEVEDRGKVVWRRSGHRLLGGSPESPCQFLECHLALFAWDGLLG